MEQVYLVDYRLAMIFKALSHCQKTISKLTIPGSMAFSKAKNVSNKPNYFSNSTLQIASFQFLWYDISEQSWKYCPGRQVIKPFPINFPFIYCVNILDEKGSRLLKQKYPLYDLWEQLGKIHPGSQLIPIDLRYKYCVNIFVDEKGSMFLMIYKKKHPQDVLFLRLDAEMVKLCKSEKAVYLLAQCTIISLGIRHYQIIAFQLDKYNQEQFQ